MSGEASPHRAEDLIPRRWKETAQEAIPSLAKHREIHESLMEPVQIAQQLSRGIPHIRHTHSSNVASLSLGSWRLFVASIA